MRDDKCPICGVSMRHGIDICIMCGARRSGGNVTGLPAKPQFFGASTPDVQLPDLPLDSPDTESIPPTVRIRPAGRVRRLLGHKKVDAIAVAGPGRRRLISAGHHHHAPLAFAHPRVERESGPSFTTLAVTTLAVLLTFSVVTLLLTRWMLGISGAPQVSSRTLLPSPEAAAERTAQRLRPTRLFDSSYVLTSSRGRAGDVVKTRFNPADFTLASTVGNETPLGLWNAVSGRLIWSLDSMSDARHLPVRDLSISPDGRRLSLLLEKRGSSLVRVLRIGRMQPEFDWASDSRPLGIHLSSRYLFVLFPNRVKLFDLHSAAPSQHFKEIELPFSVEAAGCRFSPAGVTLACAGVEGGLRIVSLDAPRTASLLPAAGSVRPLAFRADGRYLAFYSERGIEIADLQESRVLRRLPVKDVPLDADFSPDGQTLAVATENGVQLWDVQSGQLSDEALGGGQRYERISFAKDGLLVAAASVQQIRIWRVS